MVARHMLKIPLTMILGTHKKPEIVIHAHINALSPSVYLTEGSCLGVPMTEPRPTISGCHL